MATNKISKLRKGLMEGCILEVYGSKDFFKVYPVPSIDKVKFSFAGIGKGGKGFDIYVDTLKFLNLCESIVNGSLVRAINAEKSQYPTTWNYVTGKDGSKELHLGKSQKGGAVIQGVDKTQQDTANTRKLIPCSFEQLWEMAKLYLIVMGYVPVTGYFGELKRIFEEGTEKSAGYYKNIPDDEELPVTEPVRETADSVKAETVKAESAKTETVKAEPPVIENGSGKLVVSAIQDTESGFACQIKGGGCLVFSPKNYETKWQSQVKRFREFASKQKETSLTINYQKSGNRYFFLSFV